MTSRRCFILSGTWSDSPVSTHFRALAGGLVKRGHQVVFLVDKHNYDVEDHDGNPAVYTWPSPRPTRLRDAIFLRSIIDKYRPDCMVSAFGSTNVMLAVGWWMGIPCRATWYLTLTDAIVIDDQLSTFKFRLLQRRKRWVYSLATHVLPNSAAGKQDACDQYGIPEDKCTVLYLSLPDPTPELGDQPIEVQPYRTICVGRLHPTKGQDVLLSAIPHLAKEFPEAVFEFVGDGPCRADCEQLATDLGIDDHVQFSGRVPHDEVMRRMAAATVSVVPSRSECFGLVNIESLATGTPVVASDVGGIGEIFDDGVEGYLVPSEDPQALADRLSAILGDHNLRARMSESALRRFEKFEQGRLIAQQVEWFESLVASPQEACLAQKSNGARPS